MNALISISFGILMILIALGLIRKEFLNASKLRNSEFSGLSDENVKEVVTYLNKIEATIEEMNQSFYDIANDLEEKYSMHNKEIELLDAKVKELGHEKQTVTKLSTSLVQESPLNANHEKMKQDRIKDVEQAKVVAVKNYQKPAAIHKNESAFKSLDPGVVNSYPTEADPAHDVIEDISLTLDEPTTAPYNLKDEILKLKLQGMDAHQIAKHLNRGVREVKMLINFIQ